MEHDQEWARLILQLDSVANRLHNHGLNQTAMALMLYAQQDETTNDGLRNLIAEAEKILEAIA